ncbi:hypothetical protein HYPSUDRAFT_1095193 [Hypholoma sublateritium FD-334 SS-4]|uniref:Sodium/nucleoside cotransporter n=1 Tax=Hypholoma sublateritium (strain FD-334 SS-4) TaxID=945553 RepID=A0A0D2PGW0_HYPSF|nr:hypothetical protein HYPSUDRAFT_1095193 [Hypholoma sublateritium FD-334 SS-4]
MASIAEHGQSAVKRTTSQSSGSSLKEKDVSEPAVYLSKDPESDEKSGEESKSKYRPFILGGLALLILGWWVSATILKATRHRWIVQTLFAWFFILLIVFQYVPTTILTKPIEAVWVPLVERPWYTLGYRIRLAIGWLCLLAIIFGSAFGFELKDGAKYTDRVISIAGILIFQTCLWASSKHRNHIPWPTVIVGLFLQQVIALFVLKSGAGFSVFKWIATLASDFLGQSQAGAVFFFDQDTYDKHWFFVGTLASIIFFIAFVEMMYYLGVMQWVIGKFAWLFLKLLNVSGAEAVVAAASPWVGQGESACLVRPYVDLMTESELHVAMTSGFSTIAGSVLAAYITLGIPATTLVTSSVMSIPASISISKLRSPEMDEPVTRGSITVDRGTQKEKDASVNALHAFSKGALFGLIVAGQILTNVLTVLSLVAMINGLLTWIGHGFGIHQLTLQLIIGYIFYPITFFLAVPRSEILTVSKLFATKLVANEFSAYLELTELQAAGGISTRAFTIASYGLCGFANLGSLGIQIGVLSALGPTRAKIIARIALSAMICGFLSTLQTAGIV